jgi:hypothetical protein
MCDWLALDGADWSEPSTSSTQLATLLISTFPQLFSFNKTMSSSGTNDTIKEQIQEFVDAPKNFVSK